MGWFQDNLWNNIFKFAYPLSFLGSIAYGILAITQTNINDVFINKNWVIAFNIFIGLCGLLSLAAWFGTDLSSIDPVTKLIDLNANTTRNKVLKTN